MREEKKRNSKRIAKRYKANTSGKAKQSKRWLSPRSKRNCIYQPTDEIMKQIERYHCMVYGLSGLFPK